MADTKTKEPEAQRVIIVGDQRVMALKTTADEMRELRKAPLDRTAPGGRFLTLQGEVHDAEGNKLGDLTSEEAKLVDDLRARRGLPALKDAGKAAEPTGTEEASGVQSVRSTGAASAARTDPLQAHANDPPALSGPPDDAGDETGAKPGRKRASPAKRAQRRARKK